MRRFPPLTWQVLWPPAAVFVLAVSLAAYAIAGHNRAATRLGEVLELREALERSASQLANRHRLTLRRARGALNKPSQRLAFLSWTSEHYATEMDRLLQQSLNTLRSPPPGQPKPAAQDLERIGTQLRQVAAASRAVTAVLDRLLGAVSIGDDLAIRDTAADLERADAAMSASLTLLSDLIRKTTTWQMRDLVRSPASFAWPLLLVLCVATPLAFWLGRKPLARLGDLTDVVPDPDQAHSREERELASVLQELLEQQETEETKLEDAAIELERLHKSTRRLERELALLRLYNDNLVNSLRSAIVVTDAQGTTTAINRSTRQLLGLDQAHLGVAIEELPLYHALAKRGASARSEVEAAMGGKPLRVEGLSYRPPHETGRAEILLDLTVTPYRDESGSVRGLLWVTDDITDAVRTKNQLLVAEQLATMGRLSAQVAHEIRNPLSAIGLNAEMLEEELELAAAPAQSEKHLAEAMSLLRGISSEVERLSQITEGYLQLARLPRPDCSDNDLNRLVGDLVTMLGPELRHANIEVELDLATPPPRAMVDPGQLRQAMLNIVRNSRDAMADGGTLHIASWTDAATEQATLQFRDTGPGISDEARRRVFEPFYTTKPDGTGLGLSLTEQIIADHNGQIELCPGDGPSTNPGTVVTLSLPLPESNGSASDPDYPPG